MTRREEIARALHEAHKPYCDWTYPFEHPQASRHVYEALADAILSLPAQEPGAHAELVKRLLASTEIYNRGPNYSPLIVPPSEIAIQAASALMDQAAEIERMGRSLDDSHRQIEAINLLAYADFETTWKARAEKAEAERDDYKRKLDDAVKALEQAEACMSIVEPRSDKAEYLRILGVVRAALTEGK